MKITNTSTLVSLAKINRLNLIKDLNLKLVSPKEIYEEATVKKNYVDSMTISKYFEDGTIDKKTPKNESKDEVKKILGRKLKEGDHAVISLAHELKATHVITDDEGLQKVARSFQWKVLSSPEILLLALKKGVLEIDEYRFDIRNLVLENRMSSELSEFYILEGEKCAKNTK